MASIGASVGKGGVNKADVTLIAKCSTFSLMVMLFGCQVDVRLRVDRLGSDRVALVAADGGGGADHCIESVVVYGPSNELIWDTRRSPSMQCQTRVVISETPRGYVADASGRLERGKAYSALVTGGGYTVSTSFTF